MAYHDLKRYATNFRCRHYFVPILGPGDGRSNIFEDVIKALSFLSGGPLLLPRIPATHPRVALTPLALRVPTATPSAVALLISSPSLTPSPVVDQSA